ncbi:ParA family protein [Pseudoprimorskyibacter insulae]|uniref:Chromosome-partitioning ATPase Soj n=1 Tax=Pseudoprimorskyibacter insulae TaxID=1695997 RepID=A0A2R8AVK6_9RHOB|nr:ParA family protein [Pseudoprimorskyibacter insulae]SPF80072.1 Chromosome-partitioning ATPase Soj [Pseudoprimorskyibacter insulae]
MRVLVFNQKSGVGKTTTVMNVAAGLLRCGVGSVTVADLDPAMHLTRALGHDGDSGGWDVESWLEGVPGNPLDIETEPGLALIPGNPAPAEDRTASVGLMTSGGEWLLLDAPPSWSPRIEAVMRGADLILCPLEPDFLGMQEVNRLLRTMQSVEIGWDRLRILLTRFNSRLAVHREVRARLRERFGDEIVLTVPIRSSVRLADETEQGTTIFNHAPKSVGAYDYLALAERLSGRRKASSTRRRTRP